MRDSGEGDVEVGSEGGRAVPGCGRGASIVAPGDGTQMRMRCSLRSEKKELRELQVELRGKEKWYK